MKRMRFVFLILAVAMLMTACTPAESYPSFDEILPWINSTRYEACVYDVSRTRMDTDSEGNVTNTTEIARGTLKFELFDDTPSVNMITLKSHLTITYNDNATSADRGKTDTILTETVVRYNFEPLSSYREVALDARGDADPVAYTIDADYENTNKATYTIGGKSTQLSLGTSRYIDNEALLYAVRSFKDGQSSVSFSLANLFDAFQNGEFFTYPMVARMESEPKTVDNLPATLDGWGLESGASGFKVDCTQVTLYINTQNSGPALDLLYAQQPFSKGSDNQRKVLIQMVTKEYDISAVVERYRNTYTLNSLATNPN